eukprot:6624951-Pyramimonas_sp.AAC.1
MSSYASSFPRFRSFPIVRLWPHFCASGRSKSCCRCNAGASSRSQSAQNLQRRCVALLCEAMRHYAMSHHAMT